MTHYLFDVKAELSVDLRQLQLLVVAEQVLVVPELREVVRLVEGDLCPQELGSKLRFQLGKHVLQPQLDEVIISAMVIWLS
jgi:hypothetical protein